MVVPDYTIQTQVRALLVRNWMDTRRIDYNVIGGVVHMRGTMAVLYEHPERDQNDEHGISARLLVNLERDMMRVDGVKAVHYDLSNWIKTGGMWIKRTYVR
jgi:hypothetical protein